MTQYNLIEEIKHGNYYSKRVVPLEVDQDEVVTQADVDWIMSLSPYYKTRAFSEDSIKIHERLLATGRYVYGWAEYYIVEVEDE